MFSKIGRERGVPTHFDTFMIVKKLNHIMNHVCTRKVLIEKTSNRRTRREKQRILLSKNFCHTSL